MQIVFILSNFLTHAYEIESSAHEFFLVLHLMSKLNNENVEF